MGAPARDLSGQRFGALIVLSRAGTRGKSVTWDCLCDCGTGTTVLGQNLKNGSTISCGCSSHPRTHGMTRTRLYQTWASMHARCRSPSFHAKEHYADKGVTVCDEWRSFESFRDWAMRNGYADDLTLDRINNDLGYAPSNCRFITIAEQQRNKTNHRMLTHGGESLPLYQWAGRLGCSVQTLHNRLSRGWSVQRSVTTPVRRK